MLDPSRLLRETTQMQTRDPLDNIRESLQFFVSLLKEKRDDKLSLFERNANETRIANINNLQNVFETYHNGLYILNDTPDLDEQEHKAITLFEGPTRYVKHHVKMLISAFGISSVKNILEMQRRMVLPSTRFYFENCATALVSLHDSIKNNAASKQIMQDANCFINMTKAPVIPLSEYSTNKWFNIFLFLGKKIPIEIISMLESSTDQWKMIKRATALLLVGSHIQKPEEFLKPTFYIDYLLTLSLLLIMFTGILSDSVDNAIKLQQEISKLTKLIFDEKSPQRNSFFAGFNQRCGVSSPLMEIAVNSSLFDKQVLRIPLMLAGLNKTLGSGLDVYLTREKNVS